MIGAGRLISSRPGPYSYLVFVVRRRAVEVSATVTSKGQVTIPKQVREALGIVEGDQVLFRVEGGRAILARTRDLLDMAGTVSVPAAKRGARWDEVRRVARAARGERVTKASPAPGGRRAG